MERINVIGTSGSGKSTFARELSSLLELPHHEIDQLFWKPGWKQSTDEELLSMLREVTSEPRWILDGNYSRSTAIKWERVQLVIWLDLPFPRTIYQVTKRTITRAWSQQEIWPGTGNRESLVTSFLSPKSVIWWAITTHHKNRRLYSELTTSPEYAHITFVRLRSPREVRGWLSELR